MDWVWAWEEEGDMSGPNIPSASEVAERVWFLKRCAVIKIIVMPLQGTGRLYKMGNNGARF